jgi:hypothetical protein
VEKKKLYRKGGREETINIAMEKQTPPEFSFTFFIVTRTAAIVLFCH